MNVNDIFYRRDGKSVYIKRPTLNELSFTQKLWGDSDTMTDVGRVIDFPKQQWESFYKKTINPTDGRNFYCLVYTYDDIPVGEASFHGYDSATKTARLNVRIHYKFRGNGYGKEAMRLILEYFFHEFGGNFIVERVVGDKYTSILEKEGFKFINKNKGESLYRLSKDDFLSKGYAVRRKIGIIIYPGVDFVSVSYALKLFGEVNNIAKDEIFTIKTIGNCGSNIDESGLISIPVNEKLIDNYNERFDVVIVPGNKNFEMLMSKELVEFIKICVNNCELIGAYEEGIMPLALIGALRGLKVCLPKSNRSTFKQLLGTSLISDKNIIDNGRIVVFNELENIFQGYMYIIKKLCGETIYKTLLERL